MKTLEELVEELGLKPYPSEVRTGRKGNFVIINDNNKYITTNDKYSVKLAKEIDLKVIEVKPEWNVIIVAKKLQA